MPKLKGLLRPWLSSIFFYSFYACTFRPSTPSEPASLQSSNSSSLEDDTVEEKLFYDCEILAPSNYHSLRIYKYNPYASLDPALQSVQQDESDTADPEQLVIIDIDEGKQSLIGACNEQEGKPMECHNNEDNLRLSWQGAKDKENVESVNGEEDWLFTRKKFSLKCQRKT